MNPRFQKGVILLGAVVPLLLIVIVLNFLSSKKKSVAEEFDNRAKVSRSNLMAEQASAGTKRRLESYTKREGQWDTILKTSDVGSVTGLLKEIASEVGPDEKFRQNDFNFVNRATGIGSSSRQSSVTYNISVSGTFQALQESMLSLESQRPNLSLNSLALKPQREGQLLEAEISYSAWIK